MKQFFIFLSLAFYSLSFSQQLITAYQSRVDLVAQANINSYLTGFAGFGAKTTGSANNNNTFNWLKSKYLEFGYTDTQITENIFTYNDNSTKNLILTKTGTTYPNIFVIVCGHYDTIGGPGVNDNGSGTAAILEMARILKNIPTEYSIKFINFTGEEQGLRGSQHYVNSVVNSTSPKMNIKLVLNIDQVGGVAGEVNNTVTCERDQNNSPSTNNAASAAATQQLMTCVSLYSPLQTNLAQAYGSDYMPFQANGDVITGLFEFNESNKPHTSADTYGNMDPVFVYNVTKGALGALQHFAVASPDLLKLSDISNFSDKVSLYPNPAKHLLNIGLNGNEYSVSISDLSGKLISHAKNQQTFDVSAFSDGVYFMKVEMNGLKVSKKFTVRKQ